MAQSKPKFDFTKRCWYCNADTMKPDFRGYKCSNCGATWSRPQKLGSYPVSVEIDNTTGQRKFKPRSALGRGSRIKSDPSK